MPAAWGRWAEALGVICMWRLFAIVAIGCGSECMSIAQSTNAVVTITARPRLEVRGQYKCFTVTNTERAFRLWALGEEPPVPGVMLDTNRVYEFVFTNQ